MCADVSKHGHDVRTEVRYKPQRQSVSTYHIIFFILFHEVIRDIFILSKIINTIFNYITDNLKNMDYEKTSQSKQ